MDHRAHFKKNSTKDLYEARRKKHVEHIHRQRASKIQRDGETSTEMIPIQQDLATANLMMHKLQSGDWKEAVPAFQWLSNISELPKPLQPVALTNVCIYIQPIYSYDIRRTAITKMAHFMQQLTCEELLEILKELQAAATPLHSIFLGLLQNLLIEYRSYIYDMEMTIPLLGLCNGLANASPDYTKWLVSNNLAFDALCAIVMRNVEYPDGAEAEIALSLCMAMLQWPDALTPDQKFRFVEAPAFCLPHVTTEQNMWYACWAFAYATQLPATSFTKIIKYGAESWRGFIRCGATLLRKGKLIYDYPYGDVGRPLSAGFFNLAKFAREFFSEAAEDITEVACHFVGNVLPHFLCDRDRKTRKRALRATWEFFQWMPATAIAAFAYDNILYQIFTTIVMGAEDDKLKTLALQCLMWGSLRSQMEFTDAPQLLGVAMDVANRTGDTELMATCQHYSATLHR